MLSDTQATISRLHELKALGVRIAIDDFGTGYSSLSYLSRFPVDYLKIARELVDLANPDSDGWAVASAIVALGKALGLPIVAEGIEEPEQLVRLRGLDCDFGQGFLFARPLDGAALLDMLQSPSAEVRSAAGIVGARPLRALTREDRATA